MNIYFIISLFLLIPNSIYLTILYVLYKPSKNNYSLINKTKYINTTRINGTYINTTRNNGNYLDKKVVMYVTDYKNLLTIFGSICICGYIILFIIFCF